jgi:HSP20 family molecular chaperone IbpA
MEQTIERIDDLIGQVEKFYRSLTGQDAPPARDVPYAPIPPERDPEHHLTEQVDRLLATLGQLSPAPPLTTVWVPSLAMWETRAEVWICLDLPGVPRDSVQIRVLSRGMLEITGERRPPRFDGDARRLYDESPRGPFRRVVPLSPHVAAEHIEARLKDGTLEIRVPRVSTSEPEARAVPIS